MPGWRLIPPQSLHPRSCTRDAYAVLDHLRSDTVCGRCQRNRQATPNDLKRGLLWYKQSAAKPVRLFLDITIPHTTPSPVDGRHRSVKQQSVRKLVSNVVSVASHKVSVVEDDGSIRAPEYRDPGERFLPSIQEESRSMRGRLVEAG